MAIPDRVQLMADGMHTLTTMRHDVEDSMLSNLPNSPITRSTSVTHRDVLARSASPKINPNEATHLQVTVATINAAASTLASDKPVASPVGGPMTTCSQDFMSPKKTKRVLQPIPLFSPRRGRGSELSAGAEVVTPPRHPPAASRGVAGREALLASPPACRTPTMQRVLGTQMAIVSPARSEDARQLLFLAAPPLCNQELEPELSTPVSAHRSQSAASCKASGAQYISQRNRAAALARWHKHKEGSRAEKHHDAAKSSPTGAASTASAKQSGRKRKGQAKECAEHTSSPMASGRSLSGHLASIDEGTLAELATSHQEISAAASGSLDEAPSHDENDKEAAVVLSPIDAGAQDGDVNDETFEPRSTKRRRRSCYGITPFATPQTSFRSPDAPRSGKMRRGAPPGPQLPRDPEEDQLQGDFTSSETIQVNVPGRPAFQLERLCGAPHGLPGLALRQVQCIVVPHTDRTSAFYLAMVRAAEQVGGLVRSASRAEMALLSASGAVAKGACRASLATFPAVCRGLWRLGVDDATLEALMAHDNRHATAAAHAEVRNLQPSVLAFDAASPDASRQGHGKKACSAEMPPDGQTPLDPDQQPMVATAPDEVPPAQQQPMGSIADCPPQQHSGGRRSVRARRMSQQMQMSREQAGVSSNDGTSTSLREHHHVCNAGHLLGNQGNKTTAATPFERGKVEELIASAEVQDAISKLRIDPAWLPLLQRPPPLPFMAMFAAASEQIAVMDGQGRHQATSLL